MTFDNQNDFDQFLMEGALGERLKREYHLAPDKEVALASHVYDTAARAALKTLWNGYYSIARSHGLPFLATTPTRRVNKERLAASKYSEAIFADNVSFLKSSCDSAQTNMYAGALIGCKGDAYKATEVLSEEDAQRFHSWTIEQFAIHQVDFFYAGIMPALCEAAGMAKALSAVEIPYIISFMIRDNGRLIDGTTIHDAISYIDDSVIHPPLCYMTNCVHPKVLYKALSFDFNNTAVVRSRFNGIQANTSPLTPEELDNCEMLHTSNPDDFAADIARLKNLMNLKIIGGCCGTDDIYMEALAKVF